MCRTAATWAAAERARALQEPSTGVAEITFPKKIKGTRDFVFLDDELQARPATRAGHAMKQGGCWLCTRLLQPWVMTSCCVQVTMGNRGSLVIIRKK